MPAPVPAFRSPLAIPFASYRFSNSATFIDTYGMWPPARLSRFSALSPPTISRGMYI